MKRFVLAAAVVSVLGGQIVGGANHSFSQSGTIAAPNPASLAGLAATEIAASCDIASPLNGLDGIWYDITGFAGHTATVTPTGGNAGLADFDAWFYDDSAGGCGWINTDVTATNGTGASETGAVPAGATHVVVDYVLGVPLGTFALSIS